MIVLKAKLYNKILVLSRNKFLYSNIGLSDTFLTRINLIFFHSSFLTIKLKNDYKIDGFKKLSQNLFDYTFQKIELNMREIGYGDVTVNKNMKILVNRFYDILLKCESYVKLDLMKKKTLLLKYFFLIKTKQEDNLTILVDYFDKYSTFCYDLSTDDILKAKINFNY